MRTDVTPTGWVETVVTTHTIKICKSIMTVEAWNKFNVKQTVIAKNRLSCHRCKVPWTEIPGDQHVNICMMEKEVNRTICDTCASEIDQSLILK